MSNQPIIALLYDFDKTLCTQDMQNYAFIPSPGTGPGGLLEDRQRFRTQGEDGQRPGLYVRHAPGVGEAGHPPDPPAAEPLRTERLLLPRRRRLV